MTEIVSSSCSSQLSGRGRGADQELLVLVGIPDHRHAGQRGRPGQRLESGVQQQVPCTAVPQDVPDLGAGQAVVDGDQDPARGGHAEMRLDHLRGVEQQRGDTIALAQPRRPERVAEPPGPLGELPVGVPPLAIGDCGLVRVHVGRPVQEVDRVQFRAEHFARYGLGPGRTGGRGERAAHHLPPSGLWLMAPAGCSKTPGFMIPAGSSSAFAPPSASVNSCGTSRRYHRRWSRPTAW